MKINGKNYFTSYQFFIVALLICFLIFGKDLLGTFFLTIGENGSSAMSSRLVDLGNMLAGNSGISADYSSSRFAIPLKSFKTFIEHPIFGICYMHGNGFVKATIFGAGNHCEWVDALCNYGLVGGIPYLYIFFHSVWRIYNQRKGVIGAGLLFTFVFLGLFNPFRCMATCITIFLILPILADRYGDSRGFYG